MVYVAAMIAGGGLVLVSSLAGGGDADIEMEGEADLGEASFYPFFQLKFWSFFAAFFGLTGFLLHRQGVNDVASLIAAIAVGLFIGLSITWSLHKLQSQQRGSLVSVNQVVGLEGLVRTAVRGETPGEIRISVGGRTVDYLAVSDATRRIEAGEQVVVLSVDGMRLRVMPKQELVEGGGEG